MADETEAFLIRRGFLTPEQAKIAKLAAARWLARRAHQRRAALLAGPRPVEQSGPSSQAPRRADLAMSYTDTLARAWGAQEPQPGRLLRGELRLRPARAREEIDIEAAIDGALMQRRPDRVAENDHHQQLIDDLEAAEAPGRRCATCPTRARAPRRRRTGRRNWMLAATSTERGTRSFTTGSGTARAPTTRVSRRQRVGALAENLVERYEEREGALPPRVRTPEQLEQVMSLLDELVDQGEAGRMWYEARPRRSSRLAGGNKERPRGSRSCSRSTRRSSRSSATLSLAIRAYNQYRVRTGEVTTGAGLADRRPPQVLTGGALGGAQDQQLLPQLPRGHRPRPLRREKKAFKEPRRGPRAASVTSDMWMARVFGYLTDSVAEGRYDVIEEIIQHLADERPGWKPKQVQAAIWTAIKERLRRRQRQHRLLRRGRPLRRPAELRGQPGRHR